MADNKLFDKSNEVKANFWSLKTIGDTVKGVLVDKKVVLNSLKQPAVKQTIYTLIQDDGTPIFIGGRGNQDPQVIAGLEQCKMGQYVGLKYEGDRESQKPGMQPAKIVRVYTNGKMEEEILATYRTGGMTIEKAEDLIA
jgi:hypothetical protein